MNLRVLAAVLLLPAVAAVVVACSDGATSSSGTSPDGFDASAETTDDGSATSPDAGADATTTGPLPEPPPTGNRGAVFLTGDATSTGASHSAGAAFVARSTVDQSVTKKAVGPCAVEIYGNGAGPKETFRSAGKLTFTGLAKAVTLTPAADKTYDRITGSTALFVGGETFTVTADGADVPAFTATLMAPSKLTLTAPALPAANAALKVTRSSGIEATWTGASSGEVVLYFDEAASSNAFSTTCTFPASAGKGTIPAAAFADFPSGAGTFNLYVKTVAVLTPADGYVRVTASSLLVSATGAGASGDSTFE